MFGLAVFDIFFIKKDDRAKKNIQAIKKMTCSELARLDDGHNY